MNFIDDLDDDETFSILSHPIRRRILKQMFANDGISFSTMSQEWGIATGTIYHHIAKLSTIVYQNESNEYILNDQGISLCEWFLKEKHGKATIEKIDTFTILTYPLVKRINENVNVILLFLPVAFLVGFYLSSLLNIIAFGPFLFPATDFFGSNFVFFTNFFILGIMTLLYCLTIYGFNGSSSKIDKTV
ncbi:MAG: winged helix-turn-helix domain-containing protein, partial [Candidatus Kariarchaeaceae archaeon]